MASQFIPFSAWRPPVQGAPSFLPQGRPVPRALRAEVSSGVPATKEWADLAEALHLGLGASELEAVTRGLPLDDGDPSRDRPLPLRDFGRPAEPRPVAGRIPTIVVTRADDIVRKVTIECTCGETLSLDCVY